MSLSIGELIGYLRIDETGVDEGLSRSEQRVEGFGKAAGALGAAAGGALGAGLSVAMTNAVEMDTAMAKMSAQLGLGAAESERIGGVAGSLYASAYGESMPEVTDAITSVMQNISGMSTATDAELQSTTGQIMSLAQAMEIEVGQGAAAVGQMIRTGLVGNATEALDLLAAGTQNGANRFGDLADTVAGSAGTLAQFGLSGADSIGLITQTLDAGAPSADFFIGALEELAGNAGDSVEVFDSLGLSGEQMAQDLNAGGDVAKNALGALMEALRNMQDPAARSTALVGLFGEEATAMQAALLAVDPSTAVDGLGEVAGAAAALDATIGDTAANRVTAMQRGWEQWSASLIATEGPMGTAAATVAAFGPAAIGMAGSLAMIGMAIGPLLVKLGALVISIVTTAARWALSLLGMAANAALAVGRILISLILWVAQTVLQGALAVASMAATAALYIAQWILMGAQATARAVIMAAAWIIGVVTPAAAALISMAITAAGYVAQWVIMAAGAMARAAIMAAAWLVAMGPVGIIIGIIVGLVALIIANWDSVVAFTTDAWNNVTQFISDAWNNIIGFVTDAIGNVVRFITDGWNNAVNLASDAWTNIVRAVTDGARNVVSFVAGLPGQILGALGNLGTLLWNAGRDLIMGLWNGIRAMGAWLAGQIMGFIRSFVPGPILQFLGIASPSKFMRDEVGKWIPEGLADGIIGNAKVAGDAARDMAMQAAVGAQRAIGSDGAALELGGLRMAVTSRSATAAGGSGGTVDRSVTVEIHNPLPESGSDSINRRARTLAILGSD